jgi:hypothetical protein
METACQRWVLHVGLTKHDWPPGFSRAQLGQGRLALHVDKVEEALGGFLGRLCDLRGAAGAQHGRSAPS